MSSQSEFGKCRFSQFYKFGRGAIVAVGDTILVVTLLLFCSGRRGCDQKKLFFCDRIHRSGPFPGKPDCFFARFRGVKLLGGSDWVGVVGYMRLAWGCIGARGAVCWRGPFCVGAEPGFLLAHLCARAAVCHGGCSECEGS